MKRLIQISLIVILVLVLFQAALNGSVVTSNRDSLGTGTTVSSVANTTSEDVRVAACLVSIHGVVCVKPNVGWNS